MRLSKKFLVIFLLAILVCQAAVFFINMQPVHAISSPVYENILGNPGFETGSFTNWTASGAWVSSGSAHSGTYKATINIWSIHNFYQTFSPIPVAYVHEISYYAMRNGGVSGDVDCWVYYSEGGYTIVNSGDLPGSYAKKIFPLGSLTPGKHINKIMIQSQSSSGYPVAYIDDVSVQVPSLTLTADLDNVDPSSANWAFVEWKYYTFTVAIPPNKFSGSVGTVWFGFSLPTQDGTVNFITWSNGTDWLMQLAPNSTDRSLDPLRIKAGSNSTDSDGYYLITFPIWFTSKCLDTLDPANAITVLVKYNDTSGFDSGWLSSAQFFQIYNRGGGSTETQIIGSAGQILGGKQFSFYANAGGQVFSDMIFRNLQHIKMLPEIRGYAGEEQWTVSGGVDYSLDDGSYLRGWQFDIEVSAVAYTGWLASQDWINMTVMWSFNNTWVKTDSIYMFYHGPVEASGDLARYRFWIDLWFDNTNSSTFGGGRINAYEFPMEDNSAVYLRWLSSSWGVKDSVEKESMCLFPLIAPDGTQLSASRISMVKVWMALAADDPQGEGPHQYVIMDKFDVWDTTLGKIPLEGIQTPSFDETKMPVMQNSGFLGFLFSAISGLFKWISDNIIFGGLALWPTFVGFLDTIAGWLGAPHFFTNLFTWLGSGWSWFASSFMYAITIIADIFLMLATTMGYIVWTLGQAIVGFASTIGMLAGMIGGTVGGASNLWNQLGLAQWLSLGIIIYPIYLVFLWEHEGMDAVIAQLSMIWGILSWLAHFFITVMQSVITAFSGLVESIPVVE